MKEEILNLMLQKYRKTETTTNNYTIQHTGPRMNKFIEIYTFPRQIMKKQKI